MIVRKEGKKAMEREKKDLLIMTVDELKIGEDFQFLTDKQPEFMVTCGICSNCCYSDCIGGY